jgi:hypothetical protein
MAYVYLTIAIIAEVTATSKDKIPQFALDKEIVNFISKTILISWLK